MSDGSYFSQNIQAQTVKAQQISGQQIAIMQDESAEDSFKGTIDVAFNPTAMRNRFELLESRVRRSTKEEATGKAEKEGEIDFSIEGIQAVAESFEDKNPELIAKFLVAIRSRLSKTDSFDQLLEKVLETYPDVSLADEALDFLIATSESELAEKLMQVKNHLNETYAREIKAGKNIMAEAQAFSQKNLGTPTSLRDLYRDITGNPREPATLFAELATQYTFEKMKTVIAFVLHSLGQDLRSKGPSIEKGELSRLLTETRTMQAIIGVYRFFQSRMNLLRTSFEYQGLTPSALLSFENLARAFMKFLVERYPSSDKLLSIAKQLGFEEDILAEVIIFSQMKDAVRQISPRLYRSEQHKQDILATFLETLEDLEDQLEEDEDEEDS
jgi:type III secretion protein W